MGDIEVVATIPPRVSAAFKRVRSATDAEYDAALAANPHRRTLRTVLGLLRRADHMLERTTLKGRRCTVVVLELSLIPSIRLVYSPNELPPSGVFTAGEARPSDPPPDPS